MSEVLERNNDLHCIVCDRKYINKKAYNKHLKRRLHIDTYNNLLEYENNDEWLEKCKKSNKPK